MEKAVNLLAGSSSRPRLNRHLHRHRLRDAAERVLARKDTFADAADPLHVRPIALVTEDHGQAYASCSVCGERVKLRSFSATPEIEDVFDAVIAWMDQPGAGEWVAQRQREIRDD